MSSPEQKLSGAGEHDHVYISVAGQIVEGGEQAGQQRLIDGVEALGTVEPEQHDPVVRALDDQAVGHAQTRSMMVAVPMPPPVHMVTSPQVRSRRSSSSRTVPMSIAPVAPIGWPSGSPRRSC